MYSNRIFSKRIILQFVITNEVSPLIQGQPNDSPQLSGICINYIGLAHQQRNLEHDYRNWPVCPSPSAQAIFLMAESPGAR